MLRRSGRVAFGFDVLGNPGIEVKASVPQAPAYFYCAGSVRKGVYRARVIIRDTDGASRRVMATATSRSAA
jgi:hypothetical protein